MQICPAIYEILAKQDLTVTDDLISQLFVVAFVHSAYMQMPLFGDFQHNLVWKISLLVVKIQAE